MITGDFTFHKIFKYMILLVIIIMTAFIIFNEDGLLKYFSLKKEVNELEIRIDAAQKKIDDMLEEIDSLKGDLYKIEKVAREKYLMRGPKEKLIQIKEK